MEKIFMVELLSNHIYIVLFIVDSFAVSLYFKTVLALNKNTKYILLKLFLFASAFFVFQILFKNLPSHFLFKNFLRIISYIAILFFSSLILFKKNTANTAAILFSSLSFFAIKDICIQLAGSAAYYISIPIFNLQANKTADNLNKFSIYVSLINNILQTVCYSVILFLSLYIVGHIFKELSDKIKPKDLLFLSVPCLMGLLTMCTLRNLFFSSQPGFITILETPASQIQLFILYLFILLTIISTMVIFQHFIKLREEEKEQQALLNQTDNIKLRVEQMQNNFTNMDMLRHDMQKHVSTITALSNKLLENYDKETALELNSYMENFKSTVISTEPFFKTGNSVTDIVIHSAVLQAQKFNIDFYCNFNFGKTLNIEPYDMAVILGNALDNGLAAAKNSVNDKPYIDICSKYKGEMLFIIIKNSFDGNLKLKSKQQLLGSVKQNTDKHGIGLINIKKCVDKYNGILEFYTNKNGNNNEFILSIILQNNNK